MPRDTGTGSDLGLLPGAGQEGHHPFAGQGDARRPRNSPSWLSLTPRSKATAELKSMILARNSRLMDIHGVGPVVAARILADVGDVARFADRNRFTCGPATHPSMLLRVSITGPVVAGGESAG